MTPHRLIAALAVALATTSAPAMAYDWNNWATTFEAGGLEFGLRGTLQYDYNQFDDDRRANGSEAFEDDDAWRRREFYAVVRRKGVFELNVGYDFLPETWSDVFLKLNTRAGDFRVGHFKTPVGWEDGNTSQSTTLFLERSAAESTFYEGRRSGLEWVWEKTPGWRFTAAGFTGEDLNDENDGTTLAARVVHTPVLDDVRVLHLGVSASRERREDDTVRFRARPNAGLTEVRLVDTGALASDHIDRLGLEAAWRQGPWLVQGEYLTARNDAPDGGEDFTGNGVYVQAAYSLTGETRPYAASSFGNLKPKNKWGAVDVVVRFARLDLDDGDVRGGVQKDWSLGSNWYISKYLKLQANYVRVDSDRRGASLDPHLFEVRGQIAF